MLLARKCQLFGFAYIPDRHLTLPIRGIDGICGLGNVSVQIEVGQGSIKGTLLFNLIFQSIFEGVCSRVDDRKLKLVKLDTGREWTLNDDQLS